MDEHAMDAQGILELLPHRYPFLLIDRVLSFTPGESLVALKNVTVNEPFFQGHFPGRPVMPGVMMLEVMAQATGLFAVYNWGGKKGHHDQAMYYLVGVDEARFKAPVIPGDRLRIEVRLMRLIRGIYRFSAAIDVDGRVVSSAVLMTTRMVDAP